MIFINIIDNVYLKKQGEYLLNKLEKYLKHNSISQRGFAEKIGTTPNNLNLLVKGKSKPSLRLAYAIEQQTGGLVTLYDWLSDDDKKHSVVKGENQKDV